MDLLTRTNYSVGLLHHAGRPLTPSEAATYKCRHSRVLKGVCFDCGDALTEDSDHRVSFDYILPGLRLGVGEVARLKNVNSSYLLVKKKLHLVLDLDHTLIHAKPFTKLTPQEQTLKSRAVSVQDHVSSGGDGSLRGDLFKMKCGFLVKLRPFVRTFLEEASSMYEIWVCTKGNRYYAQQILNILDKDNDILSKERVIAREDLIDGKKSLDLVLGRENCTVIVDDSKEVWGDDNVTNLIEIEKYHYFKNNTKKKDQEKKESYVDKESDESEEDGALSNVLRVLQILHGLVFDDDDDGEDDDKDSAWVCKERDVRRLLKKIKSEVVLNGCNLGFTNDDDFEVILETTDEMEDGYSTVVNSWTTTSSKRKAEECLWADQNRKRSKLES